MKITLQQINQALRASWSADTAYDADGWSTANIARGQCVVSSLIVQDHLGGDLIRYEVTGDNLHETHYANLIDGIIIDTTGVQYITPVSMKQKPDPSTNYTSLRDKCIDGGTTRQRYHSLKHRVDQLLNHN